MCIEPVSETVWLMTTTIVVVVGFLALCVVIAAVIVVVVVLKKRHSNMTPGSLSSIHLLNAIMNF